MLTSLDTPVNLQLFRGIFAKGVPLRIVCKEPSSILPEDVTKYLSVIDEDFENGSWDRRYFSGLKTLIYQGFSGSKNEDREIQMLLAAKSHGVEEIIRYEEFNLNNFDGSCWVSTPFDMKIEKFGITMTSIRSNFLMQSILPFAKDIREKNKFQSSSNGKKISFIDSGDVASAILNILVRNLWNKKFILTGKQAYSYSEVAAFLSTAIGQEIQYEDIPKDPLLAAISQKDIPKEVFDKFKASVELIYSGSAEFISNDLQTLGVPGRDFTEFLNSSIELFKKK